MRELDFIAIGGKIRDRRKSLGITQEQLATYMDVNPSHISNIEAGRAHPSLTALICIANFLSCSVDVFIEGEYSFEKETTLDKLLINKVSLLDTDSKEKLAAIIDILN